MSRWFRMYDEALDDPKVQKLPAEDFRGWFNLLCLASRNEGRIPPLADVAFALRRSLDDAQTLLERLRDGGLIDSRSGGPNGSHDAPHAWDKRQYKSDTSTERVKRYRKRSATVTETPPETDTEAETDIIEPKGSSPQQAADAAEQVRMDDVLAAWDDLAQRCGLPRIRGKLNGSRRVRLAARIREHPFEHWADALNAIERAKWMHGDNDRGWRADFDFLLQPGSFQRLIEGTYDRPN